MEGHAVAKAQSTGTSEEQTAAHLDWDHPFPNGIEQNSIEAASVAVPFDLVSPTNLSQGQPDLIETSPPEAYPDGEGAVAFVYHTKEYGDVLVEESTPGGITVERLADMAEALGAPSPGSEERSDAPDAFQLVAVGDAKALLVQYAGVGRITWIQGGLLFDIKGDETTPEQVVDLASELEREADKQLSPTG